MMMSGGASGTMVSGLFEAIAGEIEEEEVEEVEIIVLMGRRKALLAGLLHGRQLTAAWWNKGAVITGGSKADRRHCGRQMTPPLRRRHGAFKAKFIKFHNQVLAAGAGEALKVGVRKWLHTPTRSA